MFQHQIRQQDGRVYEFGAHNDVTLVTIAKHLSKICRFAGATRHFYSVAQHCVLVEQLMWEVGGYSAALRLKTLLHDAHEAFITDIPTPLAIYLKDKTGYDFINDLKDEVDRDIFRSLDIALPTKEERGTIKHYDRQAFCIEARQFIKNPPGYVYDLSIPFRSITAMDPYGAEHALTNRLTTVRNEIATYGAKHGAVA